ncbi:copy-number control protein [Streptococcus agalactiae LMG 14747]|uniref:Copy-number control protein n=2 Tax=Streptococcus TaxID=1301 RepID=V6Z4J5_STRAG|nr:ribbon-helix-helix domain-containing protein [Streptococcus acidominimus]ESV55206.1 copy-number control protein [Streptococcus agalactiae LMG 14747]SNV46535.1 Ribbon-helix-helix protein, copG family [Streptococcus acidominimus]
MATEKKRVSISLTDEQYELVDKIAKSRGFSKSAIFVLALEEYLKNQKQN